MKKYVAHKKKGCDPPCNFEKLDLLTFSFFLFWSERLCEPMWMESLRSKDFADFCKRHLFKFPRRALSQPQSEGGRVFVCWAKKFQRLSCRVLEDVLSSDFSSQLELYLSAIQNFVCHWLTQSNHNKKVLLGRHFGRCLDGRFLHSPKDENAHTEFFVSTKNWVSNQVQIENHWLVIKVWNGVLDRLLLYSQIYSWARA